MKNFLIGLGLIFIFFLVVAIITRFTRSVPLYYPGENFPTVTWGSGEPEKAIKLQAMLDDQINKLKVPGMQAYVRTAAGQTWSGASGTKDLRRDEPFQGSDVVRIGRVTKTFTAVLVCYMTKSWTR